MCAHALVCVCVRVCVCVCVCVCVIDVTPGNVLRSCCVGSRGMLGSRKEGSNNIN